MSVPRRAEIVGAGFAGLAAACALAQRGWRVRLHERADALRTDGAGIYIYENGLRVLEALGACDEAVAGAHVAHTRETRDDRNRILSVHRWDTAASRVYSIVRQRVIDALAGAARRAGVEIVTSSAGTAATPDSVLTLADGSRLAADLVV
ncbi:MAG TPA: FAD-dependent monooxygenase, partial [Xanthobacteraceae bacterium]